MTWKLQGQSRIMRNDETIIRLRYEVKYVDGKQLNELVEHQKFKANIQPLNGRELLLVPEHQRYIEQYWCFVPLTVSPSEPPAPIFNVTGEIVIRKDVRYQVQQIDYWGSYQRLRITRVDVGNPQNP